MKFKEFDADMRQYEQSLDVTIPEDQYVIVRLDGQGFTRLTKDVLNLEAPFDERFRNLMRNTMEYLMKDSGFHFTFGYVQSDEISLLLKKDDNTFGRKTRKFNSVLAGKASAVFTLNLAAFPGLPNEICNFDCRVIPLPSEKEVIDYFTWRMEDSARNALNSYTYWTMRKDGVTPNKAASMMKFMTTEDKIEYLGQHGISYDQVPEWQKFGSVAYFHEVEREGRNPMTGETVPVRRTILEIGSVSEGLTVPDIRNYCTEVLSKHAEIEVADKEMEERV